ncbi:MAG: prepilin-type N-terminal cleavage/methylation domain-containing protein [Candidatus Parcubacteria bacterium]|nr:prepilin-type N-terminal cleavage/methylation domain-containing protein [Candidatus Parcubacteria bacterium]
MINIIKTNKKGGFTLIETMVAITIFLITIFLVTQVYIETIRMERVAYGLLNRDNSVRYALELMARDIRMAKADSISISDSDLSDAFYDVLDMGVYYSGNSYSTVKYELKNGRIERTGGFITGANVIISELNFEKDDTYYQPRIIISFKASVGSSSIFIQTSVTPRYPYIREIP